MIYIKKSLNSTTIDDKGYPSTLRYILKKLQEDWKNKTLTNDKIRRVIDYIFRRRVLEELYGPDIGNEDLSTKPDQLTDKQWAFLKKRAEKQRKDYFKYSYSFEKEKLLGFFRDETTAEVDMFFAHYSKDKEEASFGILQRIETIYEIRSNYPFLEELKKPSYKEHRLRDEIDLYEK